MLPLPKEWWLKRAPEVFDEDDSSINTDLQDSRLCCPPPMTQRRSGENDLLVMRGRKASQKAGTLPIIVRAHLWMGGQMPGVREVLLAVGVASLIKAKPHQNDQCRRPSWSLLKKWPQELCIDFLPLDEPKQEKKCTQREHLGDCPWTWGGSKKFFWVCVCMCVCVSFFLACNISEEERKAHKQKPQTLPGPTCLCVFF